MLQHHVFIKFHPGTAESHIQELCRRMEALRDTVPGIEFLEIGRDVLHEARSWDLILNMRFASVQALRSYQQHPDHQQLMAFNAPAVAQVGAIDFMSLPAGTGS
jgi:Stress responsive A/B Barrel Domain